VATQAEVLLARSGHHRSVGRGQVRVGHAHAGEQKVAIMQNLVVHSRLLDLHGLVRLVALALTLLVLVPPQRPGQVAASASAPATPTACTLRVSSCWLLHDPRVIREQGRMDNLAHLETSFFFPLKSHLCIWMTKRSPQNKSNEDNFCAILAFPLGRGGRRRSSSNVQYQARAGRPGPADTSIGFSPLFRPSPRLSPEDEEEDKEPCRKTVKTWAGTATATAAPVSEASNTSACWSSSLAESPAPLLAMLARRRQAEPGDEDVGEAEILNWNYDVSVACFLNGVSNCMMKFREESTFCNKKSLASLL